MGSVLCGDLEEDLGKTFSALSPIQDFRTVGFRSRHLKTGLSGMAVMRLIAVRSFDALVYPDVPSKLLFAGAAVVCDRGGAARRAYS